MSGNRITDLELDSVHSVKILVCFLLDRLDRPVTEEQLRIISEDSKVINYFLLSDAMEELIKNGSVKKENGLIEITEKGRLGSEYFNRFIPLIFRKKLLRAAFGFFVKEQNKNICALDISQNEKGCTVNFILKDGGTELINMRFYAPDRSQAELIGEKIKDNPTKAYSTILQFLLDNPPPDADVEKYL